MITMVIFVGELKVMICQKENFPRRTLAQKDKLPLQNSRIYENSFLYLPQGMLLVSTFL